MLGEWGVNEQNTFGMTKAGVLNTVNTGLAKLPALKALVYWNETKFDPVGETRRARPAPRLSRCWTADRCSAG